ncbi:hypothetical protein H1235_11350 [Pseudoxanthomonas sp. NC8]|nr:hypothetical protein H1235_11350 [Pseudoxanthomonas sp. NC8]
MGSNIFAALILIVLGLFFLARNLGWIDSGLGSLLATLVAGDPWSRSAWACCCGGSDDRDVPAS